MRQKIKLVINIFLLIVVPWVWLKMVFQGGGTLSDRGLMSLKYFTVLSNLLAALAAFCWLFFRRSHFAAVLKFTAALDVMITFLVVAAFLGMIYGYRTMFSGINFWFHLTVPLLCFLEEVFLGEQELSDRELLFSILPLFLYGSVYLGNILINGRAGNDWYAFTTWGFPIGFAIFAFLLAGNYTMALLARMAGRYFRR